MKIGGLIFVTTMAALVAASSLSAQEKPDDFASKFSEIKETWAVKKKQHQKKATDYWRKIADEKDAFVKQLGWSAKNSPKFLPFSKRLEKLVASQPKHEQADTAMCWAAQNAINHSDCDWVYDIKLVPGAPSKATGPLFFVLELDPRGKVLGILKPWTKHESNFTIQMALRAIIGHLKQRAYMRISLHRMDKTTARIYRRNLGPKVFSEIKGSDAAADMKELVKALEMVEAHRSRVWGQINGQKNLRKIASDQLEIVRRVDLGQPLPALVGTSICGEKLTAKDGQGKVQMIVFWGTWHRDSIKMVSIQKALVKKYASKPFRMVGVNLYDDIETARHFIDQKRFTWPSIGDPKGKFFRSWMVWEVPTVFLVDHQGIIRAKGALSKKEIQEYLSKLIKEAENN